jgi:hypothetical protein
MEDIERLTNQLINPEMKSGFEICFHATEYVFGTAVHVNEVEVTIGEKDTGAQSIKSALKNFDVFEQAGLGSWGRLGQGRHSRLECGWGCGFKRNWVHCKFSIALNWSDSSRSIGITTDRVFA